MLSCKEAARLISEAQDRDLSVKEKANLKLHTLICSGCKNYQKQIRFIHTACQHIAKGGKG